MSSKAKRQVATPAFALTALLAALCATNAVANEWSYPTDPGRVATSPADFAAAKASWETAEYRRSWGLTAQEASTAYALGYYGQGVTVGIMDSGVQAEHQEFQGQTRMRIKNYLPLLADAAENGAYVPAPDELSMSKDTPF